MVNERISNAFSSFPATTSLKKKKEQNRKEKVQFTLYRTFIKSNQISYALYYNTQKGGNSGFSYPLSLKILNSAGRCNALASNFWKHKIYLLCSPFYQLWFKSRKIDTSKLRRQILISFKSRKKGKGFGVLFLQWKEDTDNRSKVGSRKKWNRFLYIYINIGMVGKALQVREECKWLLLIFENK